jgi:hypothetical protein
MATTAKLPRLALSDVDDDGDASTKVTLEDGSVVDKIVVAAAAAAAAPAYTLYLPVVRNAVARVRREKLDVKPKGR